REAIEYQARSLKHIGDELPASWIRVRADVEARAREVPHITQREYLELYGRHLEPDRTRALHLSQYLHDLGVFLHYQDDPLLGRTVILQNQWATEAVFRILDDEAVKARLGRFTRADCERLWRDSAYAEMHPELLALMQRFELCYLLADRRPETWLAPQLLPPAKPPALAGWATVDDLVVRYRYEFLPKGILSRLTVRQHRFVSDAELAWVTGVLFQREATSVLAEVLPSGREIELRARGPEAKALLSVISADLDALNESFPGLPDKVDRWIPCRCAACRKAATPELFAQKKLLRRQEMGQVTVQCESSYEQVDVVSLLDGVRAAQLPAWAHERKSSAGDGTIKIFLASSSELRAHRDALELYLRQQNDRLRKEGVYLEIERWENFLDAMSATRLQDEYNKAAASCDVFVSLFHTKVGPFTEEEFDAAHRNFRTTGRPRIFTFFNQERVSPDDRGLGSRWNFQDRLKELGHYHTSYEGIDSLKLQLRDQLDKLRDA
ncbi:MAG TPA: COR domain-containing protein, partial [Polyangia bacterium]|nr:COR domain-containing protein [Polyangia bacterium]